MDKQIIKNTLIVLAFFVILTMITCTFNPSGELCSPEKFAGCYQKNTDPRGSIDISAENSCLLRGMGKGLFNVGNDSNAILLIHGNANIADEAEGSIPEKMISLNGNAAVQGVSKFGAGAVSFDGSGDYLSTPDHADFNFSDGTWAIDMWVRVNALGGAYMLYYQRTDASNYMYITIRNDNTVQFGIASGGSNVVNLTTPPVISSTGRWHHIEASENGNNYYIFIDGVQQASTSTALRSADYSGAVYIGADSSGGQSLNGYLDEIRVSKIARHSALFTPPAEEYSGWEDVGWSFTGEYPASNQVTLNITMEGAGGEMFQVNASRPNDTGPLTLQRNGTSYVLTKINCTR